MELRDCRLPWLSARGTTIERELSLRGTKLTDADTDHNALVADRLRVGSAVLLTDGFEASGTVRLARATIDSGLSLRGAKLTGTDADRNAMNADEMRVGRAVLLDEGFEARGAVSLGAATIEGPLSMRGAKLTGTDAGGNALVAEGTRMGAGAFLEGLSAAGAVRLIGATIEGTLSLRGAKLTGSDAGGNALVADGVRVASTVVLGEGFEAAGTVRLVNAKVGHELHMVGAKLAGTSGGYSLVATRMVAGAVFLTGGFEAAGSLGLDDANVEGQLNLKGAKLADTDAGGHSLLASNLRVAGDMDLSDGFEAGAVWMRGATIEGTLSLSGAKLGTNADGNALVADGTRVGTTALLEGLSAAGAVRLIGATIEGQLNLKGAKLTGKDLGDNSLAADGLRVAGAVFLTDGFEAAGTVSLVDANVESPLIMSGAKLAGTGRGGYSLVADRLLVAGDMKLNEGFEAEGAVRFTGARVGGILSMSGAKLSGKDDTGESLAASRLVSGGALLDTGFEAVGTVNLTFATIEGPLMMNGAKLAGGLVLARASCQLLAATEWATPPPEGRLSLEGFQFSSLTGRPHWRKQIAWVRIQGLGPLWSPDPYEQLATWYSRSGDEVAARHVRVARDNDELTHLRRTHARGSLAYRMWRRPLGWLVGYGYRRYRAGLLLIAMIVLAGWVFLRAETEGAMAPNEPVVGRNGHPESCGEAYPCFNSWVYGADVVLPIIDFGQDGAWRPIGTREHGQLWVIARWAFIAVGWLLASIFVAAFTSLMQRG